MISAKKLVEEYRASIGKYTYDQRDCIWSIWTIIRAHGGKAKQVGSNWFARYKLRNLRPLVSRAQLYDGCAVLKTKLPGEAGYNLPEQYRGHADQIDYSHIGLGTSAGEILDSTRYRNAAGEWVRNGPGVSTAPINANGWDIIADFAPEDVDYSDAAPAEDMADAPTPEPLRDAVVIAEKGSTVNLRAAPSTRDSVAVREKVPIGAKVEVLRYGVHQWCKVRTPSGNMGYMITRFLRAADAPEDVTPQAQDPAPDRRPDTVTLTLSRAAAEYLLEVLKGGLNIG